MKFILRGLPGWCGPADDDPRCHRLPSLNHGDLGRGRHEQFCVSPFIFNSKVSTAVYRSCRYVTTNIWEMSGSLLGVGRSCKHPYYKFAHTQPPSDSLKPPQSLSAPQSPRTIRISGPILGISWAYIDHIFALYIVPVTFSEHFQYSPTTSSPHFHNNS